MPKKGWTEFDDLCDETKEVKGYAANLIGLYEESINEGKKVKKPLELRRSVEELKKHIDRILEKLKEKKKKEVVTFTIGKSNVKQRRRTRNMTSAFDLMEQKTWVLENGPNRRWETNYNKKGYAGLIVLCAITKEVIPKIPQKLKDPVELYTLALEQQLIHHYLFEKGENKLGNTSVDTGGKAGETYAGVLYVAYSFVEIDDDVEGAGCLPRRKTPPKQEVCDGCKETFKGVRGLKSHQNAKPECKAQLEQRKNSPSSNVNPSTSKEE